MWILLLYTLSIFIVTPFLPNLIQFTSKHWAATSVAHFVLNVEIFLLIAIFIIGWIFIARFKFFLFFVITSVIFISCLIIYQFLPNPYEFTHLPEYAILGFLLVRIINKKAKHPYMLSLIYATFIGIIDELYQGILPRRSFTWYDIFLNAMGAVLGLIVFWGIQKEKQGNL